MRNLLILFILLVVGNLSAEWSISGELTHYDIASPGSTISRSFEIINHSDQAISIQLKKSDYAFNADGQRWFPEAGKLSRSNSDWIDLSNQEITIAGNSAKSISYQVVIPEKKELCGSYWSVIFVQEKTDTVLAKSELQINKRYAIQSISQIGETGELKLSFLKAEFSKKDGSLELKIKNTGQRWTKADVWIEVFDSEGTALGKYNAQSLKLYPETSSSSVFNLSHLKKNKYVIIAVADCGNNKIFGSQYNLEN
jgi:hypothetical protein